jgi:PAS domain-containing protein
MLAGYELRRQSVAAELRAHPRDDSAFTVIACTCGSQMSSHSDSSEQPARLSAALNNGHARSPERRRRPRPNSPDEYLRALPASVLLDRMPVPMIAAGLDGVVVYNNPAFATMLGHGSDVMLAGYGLPALLDGHSTTPPSDCVATLRAANNVLVDWLHAEGFPVRSVVSESLYIRATDQLLLFGVTDLTELLWMYPPE